MSKQIKTTRTNPFTLEQLILKTNIKIVYIFTFIWLAMAVATSANLRLFIFYLIYFFKKKQFLTQQPHPQSQNLPIPQTSNLPIPETAKTSLTTAKRYKDNW
jgi:hypothetical protein